jgi:anti-anti-sigma factor
MSILLPAHVPVLPLVELVVRQQDLHPDRTAWLQAQLEDVLRVHPDRVVVDLGACEAMSSGALRALLQAHLQLGRRGARLVLRGVRPRVARVIGLSGLSAVFDVEDSS